MEEYLECIICYDEIDKNKGDFILDICDTCKYTVHISCYEKYLIINRRTNKTDIYDNICLMCHNSNIKFNTARFENPVILLSNHEQPNRICCYRLTGVIVLILLIVIIIILNILISKK